MLSFSNDNMRRVESTMMEVITKLKRREVMSFEHVHGVLRRLLLRLVLFRLPVLSIASPLLLALASSEFIKRMNFRKRK
jgi:hypothetical protein